MLGFHVLSLLRWDAFAPSLEYHCADVTTRATSEIEPEPQNSDKQQNLGHFVPSTVTKSFFRLPDFLEIFYSTLISAEISDVFIELVNILTKDIAETRKANFS